MKNDLVTTCPYCAEEIKMAAIKCKHCGEMLDPGLQEQREEKQKVVLPPTRKWSPGVAALLSLIIPGAGQMYKGRVVSGLLWLIIVPVGYFFLVAPGIVLHLVCIVSATSGDPYK